jgi:hypothetical protein
MLNKSAVVVPVVLKVSPAEVPEPAAGFVAPRLSPPRLTAVALTVVAFNVPALIVPAENAVGENE